VTVTVTNHYSNSNPRVLKIENKNKNEVHCFLNLTFIEFSCVTQYKIVFFALSLKPKFITLKVEDIIRFMDYIKAILEKAGFAI